MLRNWSEVVPGPGPAAGSLVSGTEFVGILGSDILNETSGGSNGAGIFVSWDPEPTKRYRALVTSLTGDLLLYENGSGEANGEFVAVLDIYEDNILVSSGIVITGQVGYPPIEVFPYLAAKSGSYRVKTPIMLSSGKLGVVIAKALNGVSLVIDESGKFYIF